MGSVSSPAANLGPSAANQPSSIFTLPDTPSKRIGPRDLVSMCLLKLSNNFPMVDRESIEALPRKYLWILWKDVAGCQTRGREPSGAVFHAWETVGAALVSHCLEVMREEARVLGKPGRNAKISAPRYGDDKDKMLYLSMYRLCGSFFNATDSLDFPLRHDNVFGTNLTMLRSAALSCLVHLCLEDVERFPRSDLLALADLPLTVLELAQYSRPSRAILLNDLLCSDWGRIATSARGFSKLRLLRITSKWHRISKDGLMNLRSFPKLLLVDINRMWRNPTSLPKPGWRLGTFEPTIFEMYASAYLGRRVRASAAEIRDMQKTFRTEFLGAATPIRAIRDHRSLRPVGAYKEEPPPGKAARSGKNGLPGGGVSEDGSDSSEDEERPRPSFSMHWDPFPVALARPWEVFAWLGLVDHSAPDPEDAETIQLESRNIPLPRRRFVYQRLYGCSSDVFEHEAAQLCRLVYRRCPEDDDNEDDDGQERELTTATAGSPGQEGAAAITTAVTTTLAALCLQETKPTASSGSSG
ncbi:hypothetical protein VTJ83DRAFT_7311 [Remersonia thermophila]|uniref:Uncharacterized protein n=1 Tax=Remersonia thermophila TaxID=72144 RepID=A0ABR4D4N9_9PEZI